MKTLIYNRTAGIAVVIVVCAVLGCGVNLLKNQPHEARAGGEPPAAVSATGGQAGQGQAATVRWEYKSVKFDRGLSEDYTKRLNEEAKDGWELHVFHPNVAVYRRPLK
jgi:hypothetical protein